ncbi:MAG TPA: ATP-binding protein [Nitrospirota bacterium]|nr:ATP-binding protein [Nitrospirota bacterium]
MFQHLIRTLREKGLFTPSIFIFTLLIVLSLIIVLGQFFHQTLQDEMAAQFNRQQLLLAREVAMNVESYMDSVSNSLRVITGLPDIERIDQSIDCRSVVGSIHAGLTNESLVAIRVLDRSGILRYDSSSPKPNRRDFSSADYFRKAHILPKNEKLVTELFDHEEGGRITKEFIIAMPVYRKAPGEVISHFRGVALAVLSMDGITKRYLAPIKSGTRGYAWMMDSDGTLLYHPNQPRMVGKNLFQTDTSCFACHISFDMEKKMIEGRETMFGHYEAPGGENKLTAFYKMPMARKSWIVVVSAPYSDVIALMQKSRRFYSLLIVSLFLTTLATAGVILMSYKKRIEAEEKAKHLEKHRELEREIEIAKEYLENIIENTRTNLMVLDKDLNIKTVNSAQAQTLGRSKDDIIGKPFPSVFVNPLPPYDGMPLEALLRRAAEGQSFEVRDYPIIGVRPDPLYLTMSINPLLLDGRTPGVLITSTDVTKRVQLEEALKQYTVELEDKVDRGTATARKLEQQVMHSEKLAALGRLAAGVAHEIGNPLTSISTFAQMLREMAQDEFSQKSLDVINTHIQRITDIVRRMATFARADSLNIKETQVNDVLQSTLDLMRLDKRMKSSITMKLTLDPSLPKVFVDEGQIAQVFINIILNALDAMPDGGTLTIATRRAAQADAPEHIEITFADTGTGIAREDLEKIFDPFYTTKEAGKGTGLGLSLSYEIVRRFNGEILVRSEVGSGTVFTINLPVERARAAGGAQ